MMLNQHPVFALILSIFMVGIIIKLCILKRSVLKNSLLASFLLAFTLAFLCVFYEDIKKSEQLLMIINYVLIGVYVIIGLFFFLCVNTSLSKQNLNKEVIDSLDESKLFVLLDKKDRIKEISNLFAKEFGCTKEELYNTKFLDQLLKKLNIISFNGQAIQLESFKRFYFEFSLRSKTKKPERFELIALDSKEEKYIYHLNMTPVHSFNRFEGRILIGERKSEENLMLVEQELLDKNQELENIRLKFISALEITSEGIFFLNLDEQYLWCNDNLVGELKLSGNSISFKEYMSGIHPDDLASYKASVAGVSSSHPIYELTYRYKVGQNYAFVQEIGKRIYENKKVNEIIGYASLVKNKHYEHSNMDILDQVRDEIELNVVVADLFNSKKTFEIVTFRLDSIPDINNKHGRNVGNMVIGEYLRMMKKNFLSEESYIFRKTGIEFVCILTDLRKMDLLKKTLEDHEKILHGKMEYASIKIQLEVYMGICLSSDMFAAGDLIKASAKALSLAQTQEFPRQYLYFKEIK